MTQSWVNLTPVIVKSALRKPTTFRVTSDPELSKIWPQWTIFWVTLTRVFLECTIQSFDQEWVSKHESCVHGTPHISLRIM